MSVESLLRKLEQLPAGGLLPVEWLRAELGSDEAPEGPALATPGADPALSWRERIWSVPAETRLSAEQVAEAVGHPVSWVYRRTQRVTSREQERSARKRSRVPERLPHRRQDGALVFLAGELREWIQSQEETVIAAPGRVRAVK